MMRRVLIVVAIDSDKPGHMNWLPLRDAMRNYADENVLIDMTSLNNLIFDISNDNCVVIDKLSDKDVADYDAVVIRNVGKTPELGIALANYLAMKNIPFTDSYLETQGAGKLACALLRRKHDISTPRTIYASAKYLKDYIKSSSLPFPLVLKADVGKKGRDNYLVKSASELSERLSDQPDISFIAQEFIENDGDYRALVMGGKIVLVIKRMAASRDTHINNTSQGGIAQLEYVDTFSSELQKEILKAARVEQLDVAGVDIILDKHTGNHYFLEVNRAPQIGTGAYHDEKIAAYTKFVSDFAKKR
jgi:glutathione synthase/RimK-type ligase-like ATP-grasp enzyme